MRERGGCVWWREAGESEMVCGGGGPVAAGVELS